MRLRWPRVEPEGFSIIVLVVVVLCLVALAMAVWESQARAEISFAIPDGTILGNNTGTVTVAPLYLSGSQAVALLTLTNGHIFVGGASGKAVDVGCAGDVSCSNAGTLTVGFIGGQPIVLANSFNTAGNFALTLKATGITVATLPAGTHSVAPLDGPAFTGGESMNGSPGVSCSGTPSGAFKTNNGVVVVC